MRVLMFTQALDPTDPVLGFTVRWVSALAGRVARVSVICLRAAEPELPSNVDYQVIGRRNEASSVRRFLAFRRAAAGSMRDADVVFSHMIPRYLWCAAAAAAATRRPMLLWYVHRRDTFELRAASALCRFVATAVPESFPFATPKLRVLGHGVDSGFFSPPQPAAVPDAPPTILFVGRLAPIKHQATLVHAIRRLTTAYADARAVFVGGAADDGRYRRSLESLAANLGVAPRVVFTGPVGPDEVRAWYRRATVAVNLSPEGLFDKSAVESMMTGTPTIVASRSFDRLLGSSAELLRVDSPDDPVQLAGALGRLMAMSTASRTRIAAEIRQRTVDAHALDTMMDRLVALMRTAAR